MTTEKLKTESSNGNVSAELVLVLPVLFLLVLAFVQLVVYEHARYVLISGCELGARYAEIYNGSIPFAELQAQRFISDGSQGSIREFSVSALFDAEETKFSVRASIATIIPGMNLSFQDSITGIRQEFRSYS